jgi:hypothetical protein
MLPYATKMHLQNTHHAVYSEPKGCIMHALVRFEVIQLREWPPFHLQATHSQPRCERPRCLCQVSSGIVPWVMHQKAGPRTHIAA